MKIIECYIENFGKLSGYTHKFTDGLNAIYAENGSGKTTLSIFIRAMFYGLTTERKQSLDDNDRKKYAPWQGGRYGGSLTFEEGGRLYRIERTFGTRPGDDIFRLVDAESGAGSQDYTENIGFELFDIDATGFERTLFLSEKNLSGAISNDSISAKLSDLVGTTGDVGAVSGAVAKLEERRKYYQKRGNTGEIAAIKQRISECDAAIDNLERRRSELDAKEARLAALEREIARAEDESASARDELAAQRAESAGRTYREQYVKMRTQLAREREEYAELEEFFKEGTPSQAEIDEARDAARDAAALRESRKDFESPELTELRSFFDTPTSFAEIESVKSQHRALESAEAELSALKTNLDFAESTLADEFGGRIPTAGELDSCISSGGSRVGLILSVSAAAASLLMLVLGFVISYLFLIAAVPLALVATVPAIVSRLRAKRALDCAKRIGVTYEDPDALIKLRERLENHTEVKRRDEARISVLLSEVERYRQTVDSYIARYSHGSRDRHGALSMIEEKHSRYYALLDVAKRSSDARAGIDMRIEHLESKAQAFTERYPTNAPDPFEDVRAKLNVYSYARRTLAKREEDLREFAVLHGINEAEPQITAPVTDGTAIEARLEDCRARIMALRREQALLESEYSSALAEVERIDEVEAVRSAYREKYDRYVENLEVIMATISMLSEASEAMTSRYIGGTKSRFEHYVSLIGEGGGEFALGSDFVLKKHEKGETRVAESYSKGTRDMHSFCLRLALSDSLYGGRAPFVMLDDPFSALDTEKLERAKTLIRSIAREKQVIYLTCSRERML